MLFYKRLNDIHKLCCFTNVKQNVTDMSSFNNAHAIRHNARARSGP